MTTFTISLPDKFAQKVDLETTRRGFATRSEFIRDLLRQNLFHEVQFETYTKKPVAEVKEALEKTGKYNQKFILSVVNGLKKSQHV